MNGIGQGKDTYCEQGLSYLWTLLRMFPPLVGYLKQDYVSTGGEIESSNHGYPIWCDEQVGKGKCGLLHDNSCENIKIINHNESISYLNQIVLTCIGQLKQKQWFTCILSKKCLQRNTQHKQ